MKKRRLWFYLTVLLGGASFVARKMEKKKRISWVRIFIGVVIAAMLIVGYGVGQVFSKADSFVIQETNGCAVVFGAAVWRDSQPSWALSDRIEAAIELYNNRIVNCFVLSGGPSTFGEHEVDVMQKVIVESGIAKTAIKSLDYNGINTLATISNLSPKDAPYVLISNDFHMARIGLIAKRKGLTNFRLHAAPYQKGRYIKNDEYFLREMAGYLLIFFGLS